MVNPILLQNETTLICITSWATNLKFRSRYGTSAGGHNPRLVELSRSDPSRTLLQVYLCDSLRLEVHRGADSCSISMYRPIISKQFRIAFIRLDKMLSEVMSAKDARSTQSSYAPITLCGMGRFAFKTCEYVSRSCPSLSLSAIRVTMLNSIGRRNTHDIHNQ